MCIFQSGRKGKRYRKSVEEGEEEGREEEEREEEEREEEEEGRETHTKVSERER